MNFVYVVHQTWPLFCNTVNFVSTSKQRQNQYKVHLSLVSRYSKELTCLKVTC